MKSVPFFNLLSLLEKNSIMEPIPLLQVALDCIDSSEALRLAEQWFFSFVGEKKRKKKPARLRKTSQVG